MLSNSQTSLMVLIFTLVASVLPAGCGAGHLGSFDQKVITVQESSDRGGAALSLRKLEMQRALRDLTLFHQTLEGMIGRRDRKGVDVLSEFATTYLKSHLNPMLRAKWHSRHPELIDLDANLRVLEADVLAQMGKSREVHRVLGVIESRYEGRENLLVNFPIGEESPIGVVVELIKLRLESCMGGRASWEGASPSYTPGSVSQAVCMGPA